MDRLRVFVAGHRGMVGSALMRRLGQESNLELITRDREELNLTRQSEVDRFFAGEAIDWVFLAAARVGGILANRDHPADFIRDNLQIQTNVIDATWRAGVRRLMFLGSSCIYPRLASQPMSEDALLTGPLESSNEAYAVAKIAGIRMCEAYHRQYGCDFRSVMPTNLYGPNDNFDLDSSHVLPALLRKFHEAVLHGQASVTVWGTGQPRREFLHVDDMAAACYRVMCVDEAKFWSMVPASNSQVNIGCGEDISIADLAELVAGVCGFSGSIKFDRSKPDGTPRKLLDVSRARALGWSASIPLREGVQQTYAWMRGHMEPQSGDAVQGDARCMSKSLQDQLKALGLAKEPAPLPSGQHKQKTHPGSARQARRTPEQERSKVANSNSGHSKPGQARLRKGASVQAGRKQTSPTAPPLVADASNLSLEQAYVLREQLRRAEEEASKEQKRLEDLKRRQINNAIKAIVEPHRLNNPDAEIARHFMYKGRIRKVNVTLEQFKSLNESELGLVYLSGGYHVLPAALVDQVRALSEDHVPDLSGGAEEEEQFPVPDDLIW